MEQLGSHWKDFHKILYLGIFRKSVVKIQVLFKSDKNNEYFTWGPIYIWSYLIHFFLECKMFQTNVVEKIGTHFKFNNCFFFRKSCRLWDNVEKHCTVVHVDDNTIRRMRIACWITRATDTHMLCSTHLLATATWLHVRASMLRYTYIACLVFIGTPQKH